MESTTRNLRELQAIQLNDTITTIAGSQDAISIGCLDDFVYVWNLDDPTMQTDPRFALGGNGTGVVSIAYDTLFTRMAVSGLDSTIRVYDLETKNDPEIIECHMMQNWKMVYLHKCFVTGGDSGRIVFFNDASKERERRIDTGDAFLSSLAKSHDQGFLASGNSNGDLHIVNLNTHGKEKVATIKPHFKLIRTTAFLEDGCKLLTGSDDCSIKLIDIGSEKVVAALEGHRQPVSHICCPSFDPKIFYSSSYDKSVKIWDLRTKTCIGTAATSNPLWCCHVSRNKLFTGGQTGVLSVYSLE